jgi:hypothetical protein
MEVTAKCVCVCGVSEFLTPQAAMRFAEKMAMTFERFCLKLYTYTHQTKFNLSDKGSDRLIRQNSGSLKNTR